MYSSVLPKGAGLKQHPNSNWELLSADCGCVVTFRILQDTSVNAYLFLVTLKISPSTWLPLSCMPSSLVYEPLVVIIFLSIFTPRYHSNHRKGKNKGVYKPSKVTVISTWKEWQQR